MGNKQKSSCARQVVIFFTITLLVIAHTLAVFGFDFERQFSYFPDESISVSIDGSRFSVKNLPPRADFDYGCIEFFTANGRNAGTEWLSREADNSMNVDMSNLPNGQYTVTFYYSKELWSTYTSNFTDNDVQINVQNGEGSMITPIMYDRNEGLRRAERMDIAALSAYLGPTDGIQSDDPVIVALATGLTEDIEDDYEKARVIHDWVANNIWYDEDAVRTGRRDDNTALGALRLGHAVCDGYARLTAALLRAARIPAKFVYGYALGIDGDEWPSKELNRQDSNHAWNEAFIDGRWVVIDTTWDSDNLYEYGRKTKNDGLFGWRYFDAALEAFSANHAATDTEWELWWLPAAVPAPAYPFAGGVSVGGVPARPSAYNIEGSNYFKLRDIAAMLQGSDFDFSVAWDAASKTVSINTAGAYTADGTELGGSPGSKAMAALPDAVVMIDGKAVYMDVRNIGGSNYFKLRDMGQAIGFSVDYDAGSNTVLIDGATTDADPESDRTPEKAEANG
jgi:transglutaminase-like putative cysteine protease